MRWGPHLCPTLLLGGISTLDCGEVLLELLWKEGDSHEPCIGRVTPAAASKMETSGENVLVDPGGGGRSPGQSSSVWVEFRFWGIPLG